MNAKRTVILTGMLILTAVFYSLNRTTANSPTDFRDAPASEDDMKQQAGLIGPDGQRVDNPPRVAPPAPLPKPVPQPKAKAAKKDVRFLKADTYTIQCTLIDRGQYITGFDVSVSADKRAKSIIDRKDQAQIVKHDPNTQIAGIMSGPTIVRYSYNSVPEADKSDASSFPSIILGDGLTLSFDKAGNWLNGEIDTLHGVAQLSCGIKL